MNTCNVVVTPTPVGEGAEYCDERVCLCVCVCLSAIISPELGLQSDLHEFFCARYLWP